jgi:hypothetical protein
VGSEIPAARAISDWDRPLANRAFRARRPRRFRTETDDSPSLCIMSDALSPSKRVYYIIFDVLSDRDVLAVQVVTESLRHQ